MFKIKYLSKNILYTFFLISVLGSLAYSGEIIGQLHDPCNLNIPAAIDITSAWVEKSGTTLTFVIATRGLIPAGVPDPCSLTYIWFVDADNNPQTGQDPGGVGSEFNVRAVIRSEREAWVDVTGSMPGGGQGTVTVNGNQIRLTINLVQINSPDLLHFRCIAAEYNGSAEQGNGVTPESAQCWISQYAVLFPSEPASYYGIDQNSVIFECNESDPFNPAAAYQVVNKFFQITDSYPQFKSLIAFAPASVDDHEYALNSLASSDFQHLRNLSYIDLNYAAGAFGNMQTKSTAGLPFRLIAKSGQTGLIPHNLFVLNISHDYHLRASAAADAYDNTYAQIVITDINDPCNTTRQKFIWTDDRFVFLDKFSAVKRDHFDLADFGLKLDNIYMFDLALMDEVTVEDPSAIASVAADTTLSASIALMLAGDLNEDRTVNFIDLAIFANNWLGEK
jgi:hypothetical protein